MKAADSRCDLFAPDVAQALAAAAAQAKGAALRSGVSADALNAIDRAARLKAAETDCHAPDMVTAASRVKQAFLGFSRIGRITYPGDVAAWQADRLDGPGSPWRLRQDAVFGADRMSFGLAGHGGLGALIAVARFADGDIPYGARLVLRDTNRSFGPYLDRPAAGPTAGLPLTKRLPPAGALTGILAEARSRAGGDLMASSENGWAFRFPSTAIRALAALDPREAVAVEFLFPGDRVRRAYVEVGDFAAGQAFVQMASR
ncbi:MAG: hypothetical protein E7812_02040 [Phenylobacterium sp.]|nr:MAG: hypothetical protein E7812_02040 [Phenylobacterium sp.]